MAYLEILLRVAQADVELVTDALIEAGALSVLVEDADRDSPDEQPLYGEPGMIPAQAAWQHSELVVLIDAQTDPQSLLNAVQNLQGAGPLQAREIRAVAEQDWVRLTQAQFEPICITENFWIVPTWHQPPEGDTSLVLRLDPGLAFGTGSHPTTRLCLRWLVQHLPRLNQPSVLDYGCGSGVLAMAARKLGARPVLGIDIDAQAVQAARNNAELNGIVADFDLPDSAVLSGKQFTVVVANILSNPLKLLAPMLVDHVAVGGWLILSGILARQAEEVAAAYAPYLALRVWESVDGWACLTGQKTAS